MNLAFVAPLLLWGLLILPVLWFLLRAIPPAPIRRLFPGVALLLGLQDEDRQADKTPWWLLLLRMAAIALAIIAFAGPVLNPRQLGVGSGPLLVLVDGGWADAADWQRRMDKAGSLLDGAERAGRPVAVVQLADVPQAVAFKAVEDQRGRLAAMEPRGWLPRAMDVWVASLPAGAFETAWITDGLDHPGRGDLETALAAKGAVTVYASERPIYALGPAERENGKLSLTAQRAPAGDAALEVVARGADPSGTERELARVPLAFVATDAAAKAVLDLPPELRNRVTLFAIDGQRSAGAVSLAGDALKRRKVALVSDAAEGEGLQLLSPLHYLRQALAPSADLIEGGVADMVPAKPDVIVLADVATLPQSEVDMLVDWVQKGGLLLRFAGPHLAATDMQASAEDPLLPVTLRQGGLSAGGAMSWGAPKGLAAFPEGSPFHGLQIPPDVRVRTQVLAEPGPDLGERTWAALEDGTPLVTRRVSGLGQVVLFHVTANAEWSDLPLSGLFVEMLERLAVSATGTATEEGLTGLVWTPEKIMNGWGALGGPGTLGGVQGAVLAKAIKDGPGPEAPAGLYRNDARVVAVNPVGEGFTFSAAVWPSGTAVQDLSLQAERLLKGPVLTVALLLLLVDIIASLALSGRLRLTRAAGVAVMALALFGQPQDARADAAADQRAIDATAGVILAYVETGDPTVDAVSKAGLAGLGEQLWNRTAVEPLEPMAVDIEKDELAFYPFLYWPMTAGAALPSAEAYAKLNRFLRTGGMILFDTRDGDVAGFGGASPEAQALQAIASGLDIPPIEPIPEDHVLTRSFYLLQQFPGRFSEGGLWVEAAPPDAAQTEGMPFRNLNDGVTPVVIGGNDWASAWAVDDNGMAMFPVGRGYAGEKQREYAYRFGVNLIMYVLTGNYKSDQVHVPALLERLGK